MKCYYKLCLLAGLCFAIAQTTMAADPMAKIPVLQREFPGLSPKGLKLGTFTVKPSLVTAAEYRSNVLQSPDNEQNEKIFTLRGRLDAVKNTSSGNLNLGTVIERNDYQEINDYDHVNFQGYAGLTHRFSPIMEGEFQADFNRQHQTRYDAGTIFSPIEPIQVDTAEAKTYLRYRPGWLGFDVDAGIKDVSYDNTTVVTSGERIVQDDRDHTNYSAGLNIRYEEYAQGEGAGFTPYLGFRINRSVYDKRQYNTISDSYTGAEQDNTKYNAVVGLDMESGSKLRGRAEIGYGLFRPDDNARKDDSSFITKINLAYLYTPLTNIIFGAQRFFSDDTNGSGGTLQTQLNARVVHELTRQWILSSGVGYVDRSFSNDFEDETWTGSAGFTYRVNDNFSLGGDIQYITRDSNQPDAEFDDMRAMIRLNSAF